MLRAYLFLLIFVPLTFVLALSAIVFTLFDSTGRFYHAHARSNHQGNFDIHSLLLAIPRQFAWIAKEELFAIPVFGHSMRRGGYIPLDRSDGRRALRSIEAAAAKIKNGQCVVIFPEGTRTLDGSLLPFKKGGFLLAARAGVPIVPVSINGSARVNPRNRIELYPGTITIRFGDPIATAEEGGARREQLMDKVRAAITAGLE
jgi:1-acyl-sn-glycerol-3-phosphate acyltransferase